MVRVATRFLTFHGDITGVSYLSMIALDCTLDFFKTYTLLCNKVNKGI